MSQLIFLPLIALSLLAFTACGNGPIPSKESPDHAPLSPMLRPRSSDPESTSTSTKPLDDKVSQHISVLLEQIHARGLTRRSMTEQDAKSLLSQLVRINGKGQIQVYIDVVDVNEDVIAQLKEKEASIELSDVSLRVIQARIPFDRIGEVAALESVRKIRPPDYGIPRSEGR